MSDPPLQLSSEVHSGLLCEGSLMAERLDLCWPPLALSLLAGIPSPQKGHSIPRTGLLGTYSTCHLLLAGFLVPSWSGISLCQMGTVIAPATEISCEGQIVQDWAHSESEVAQSCPTLCGPMDCSLPGSEIHRILQARILEWAAISFSRGSFQPRDRTWVFCIALPSEPLE